MHLKCLKSLLKKIQNQISIKIKTIRSDHGGEFKNENLEKI